MPKRGLRLDHLAQTTTDIYRAGFYYCLDGNITVTVQPGLGDLIARPMPICRPWRFDRIGTNVQTLGASSTVRLGIYRLQMRGTDFATLELDAGTVDSSTTGDKELTVSVGLKAGWYMLVAVPQGGTAPVLRAVDKNAAKGTTMQTTTLASSGGSNTPRPWVWTGITGALPATLNATPGASSAHIPWVAVRAA